MYPTDVVVTDFVSVAQLLTDHSDEITIVHPMAGENTVEVFPVKLVTIII